MTDTERERINAICKVAHVNEIDDLSDGFHTFRQLYYQRMVLFASLVNVHNDKAWKSWKNEDGEPCFCGGWFIVGIDTPQGSYTYHYEDKYWNWFECEELPVAKHWDGHTEEDVTRLLSLPSVQTEPCGDAVSRQAAIDALCSVCGVDCDKSKFVYGGKQEDQVILCIEHYALTQLPSTQPERKKGKWLLSDEQRREDTDNGNYLFFCSNCLRSDVHAKTQEVPFCWWCGSDMRGEQE